MNSTYYPKLPKGLQLQRRSFLFLFNLINLIFLIISIGFHGVAKNYLKKKIST